MIVVLLFNLLAVVTYLIPEQPWSEFVLVLSVVMIMLFVFVILLEWTWLHHMGKAQEDAAVKAKYNRAKLIYTVLFVMGFLISYWILL
ncbi:hypothetical protein MNBD_GAMMA02-868 [hydrothermal vent metagenome]|uniref:Uncharacterized protein n=1 Tax=hydrothermal vent metagenome TaxID=652676 RepID=A0A3B0WVP7_9ZZZZ